MYYRPQWERQNKVFRNDIKEYFYNFGNNKIFKTKHTHTHNPDLKG